MRTSICVATSTVASEARTCLCVSFSNIPFDRIWTIVFRCDIFCHIFGNSGVQARLETKNLKKILSGGSLGSYVDEGRSKMREIVWIAGHIEHRYSERKLQIEACLRSTPVWGSVLNQFNFMRLAYSWCERTCVRPCVSLFPAWVYHNASRIARYPEYVFCATLDFKRSLVVAVHTCAIFRR